MTDTDSKQFLDALGGDERLYQQLLLEAAKNEGIPQAAAAPYHTVTPKPAFCVKSVNKGNNEKIFINVCTEESLPKAKDISEEELIEVLQSLDPSSYRVPMSLGEPHAETDLKGMGCTAYDVVVNPNFLQKVNGSHTFMGFFMTVVLEGLEYKYNIEIDREWKILKNKKFHGKIQPQNVRSQHKPWIMDMDNPYEPSGIASKNSKPLISEMKENSKPRETEPKYLIVQDPPEGHPEFLVAEIQLPKVKSANTLSLDVGEDRIVLQTRSNVNHLDIYLPFNIVQEECGAQFNKNTQILTITMIVQPAVCS
ncbi:PIH1 domain-containing protein 1-like [Tubulanus polymorphus]|uniref:PIH1 domain-containing protein 1-like n=1 Tax=Tubulanus polymorphus TaxID=672921 RepID=UPI003DA45889